MSNNDDTAAGGVDLLSRSLALLPQPEVEQLLPALTNSDI